ncbi:unnamed protein product [Owenia fusiformis]|uniref:Inositol polyphosphate-related phosphatase domain-containing protein n=1 Tax=Owenia fusiformis TaxID=6347 RepID=A0A8S4QCK9_OWEFU|nr:unnamed protein product [Owenia fusiformis]
MTSQDNATCNFSVHLCTWNVAETRPPKDLTAVLGLSGEQKPGLTAVGIQEIAFAEEWLESLTNTAASKGYVRIKERQMQGIYLMMFALREHILYIQNIESEITQTGLGGLWGNKGGISIRFDIYGVNMCIVNCHLAAHLHQLNERINDFEDIIETQRFRDKDVDYVLDHDYVFWIGDLNFRIEELDKGDIENRIANQDLQSMAHHDQLNKIRKEQIAFLDFEEGSVNFNPTYKYDTNTDNYDTSKKQRKPAWTDRILWMVHDDAFQNQTLSVDQRSYTRLDGQLYTDSDHRPVQSQFIIQVFKEDYPKPPIEFEAITGWTVGEDGTCKYTIAPTYQFNSWDWVGLYKADFQHYGDYETYYWAMSDGSITIDKAYITNPGEYVLVYMASTDRNCVLGMSKTFNVLPRQQEQKKEL